MALHMARIHLDVPICTTPSDLYQKGAARVTQLQALDAFGIACSRASGGNMDSRIPMLELEPAHPSTLGQQTRAPPGEELNGMRRWTSKATAHFVVAFQTDGDKGEAEARTRTELHSSPTSAVHLCERVLDNKHARLTLRALR
ncbi:hypothetical protein V8C42DRAFT_342376 [Trichoderma barbatum]